MKMHSQRFKDPLISQARPVTILGPLIEASLRSARLQPDREQLLGRFMGGQPRIAVVHGSEDHPCCSTMGRRELVRRLIRQVWAGGGLPIEVSLSVPCEALSESLPGAHYAFLARNVCATNFATVMEAHGYDAAVVVAACDRMSVGLIRALLEADLSRQKRRARPVYACLIPPYVGPDVHLRREEMRRFECLRQKLTEGECREMFALLVRPVTMERYENMKACLDRAFRRRAILEAEKDELERVLATRAFAPGGICASSEASIVNRLMVAALGLVPRSLDLSPAPPSEEQLAPAIGRLIQGIQKRERRISVSHLVKTNLHNSVVVWGATGGHPSWLLHLSYLAKALDFRLSPAFLQRKMSKVPCLLSLDDGEGMSAYSLAADVASGASSGIDTLMRALSEKRFVDDRASTLDGAWMQRIMDAKSANGRYFHSTMTPHAPTCGVARVQGNFLTGALACCGNARKIPDYDKKVYFADFFLGRDEFAEAALRPAELLNRIRNKVTREDLYRAWAFNWNASGENGNFRGWSKQRLWNYLVEHELLRCVLFVAGEGPRASGMPQIALPQTIRSLPIRRICMLATDGRIGVSRELMSVAHIEPEAIEGGGLAALRTGDWLYLNLRKGEFQLVKPAPKGDRVRAMSERELFRRNDPARRIHELQRRRQAFLPSVRSVLDGVSSAADGVSPLNR